MLYSQCSRGHSSTADAMCTSPSIPKGTPTSHVVAEKSRAEKIRLGHP